MINLEIDHQQYNGLDNLKVMDLAVNYNTYLKSLVDYHVPKNNGNLVDFGSGLGTFADLVSCNKKVNIVCVEKDKILYDRLRNKGYITYRTLSEIQDNSIDGIYSINVLEHIEDDSDIIKEFHRILRPEGVAVIYVPALMFLYSSMDKKVGHFRRYNKTNLTKLVNTQAFQITKLAYADSLGVIATLLYKIIGNNSGDLSPQSVSFYDRYAFPISKTLDRIFSPFFGKNIYCVLKKPLK